MLLFSHPIWPYLRPYAHMPRATGHCDFLHLPDALRSLALQVRVNCCACDAVISPLRARQKSQKSRISGTAIEWRLFYSATCDTNLSCTRTKEAGEHRQRLWAEVGRPAPETRHVTVVAEDMKEMSFENGRARIELQSGDTVLLDATVVFRAFHFLNLKVL